MILTINFQSCWRFSLLHKNLFCAFALNRCDMNATMSNLENRYSSLSIFIKATQKTKKLEENCSFGVVNDRINIKYWHWFWLHDRENCSQFLWNIGTFIVNKYTRKWRHFCSVVRLIENCEGSTWKLVERKRLMKIDKWRHNFYSLLIIIIPLEEVQNFFSNQQRHAMFESNFVWSECWATDSGNQ